MTILMVVAILLAIASDRRMDYLQTQNGKPVQERLCTIAIIICLSLYASLRTTGNDTTGYIRNFNVDSYSGVISFFLNGGWSASKGPIFSLLQVIIKYSISDNYHFFFLVVALITNGLIITFIRKYSICFPVSVFLYLAMDGYGVSLTGMRQALATAIVIWTIPAVAQKKWLKYIVLMYLAFRIHFVSILFLVVPFIRKKVWNISVIIITILSLIATQSFSQFGELMLDTSDALGFTFRSSAVMGTGVNILRVLVYLVPGLMGLFYRRKLTESNEDETICINSSVVSGVLVGIGINGNANTFGRFGLLFEPCMYIALPSVIEHGVDKKYRTLIYTIMIISFLVYYLFGLIKNGIWTDYYHLISIPEAFF